MKISSSLSCVSLLPLSMSFASSAITGRNGWCANPARSSDKFAVQDGLLFNALREGDKVMFISQKINGVNTITKLQKE